MNSATVSYREARRWRGDWVYLVLPINIALGPMGTFVQLCILVLHETVIDIGLAAALFNAVNQPKLR